MMPSSNPATDLQFLTSSHSVFMFVSAVIMGLANDPSWCLSWEKRMFDDTAKGFIAGIERFARHLVFSLALCFEG